MPPLQHWSPWLLAGFLVGLVVFTFASCSTGAEFDVAEGQDSTGSIVDASVNLSGLSLANPTCGTGDGSATDPCLDCALERCASTYTECFGSSYFTSLFGGACDELGACAESCDCGSGDCFQSCVDTSVAAGGTCEACLADLVACKEATCRDVCTEERDAGNPVNVDPNRADADSKP